MGKSEVMVRTGVLRTRLLPPRLPVACLPRPELELNRTHEGVLEALAEALTEAGQHRAALRRWQQLVESDPERESWQRSLMSAYAQAGERILALRQYQACRKLLRERLGVEPSIETTTLYTNLL